MCPLSGDLAIVYLFLVHKCELQRGRGTVLAVVLKQLEPVHASGAATQELRQKIQRVPAVFELRER